jgi:hypothetical protein
MKNVFRSLQETVVQNLSRRCGGFLKRLGLKELYGMIYAPHVSTYVRKSFTEMLMSI